MKLLSRSSAAMSPGAVATSPLQESKTSAEPARCLGCETTTRRPFFRRALPWVQRCTQCGLIQTDPQPTDEELNEIYGPNYYTSFGHDATANHSYHEMKRASAAALLRSAERYVPVGRLLDVGSALGDLLIAGRQRGWDVEGLEPNEFAVDKAHEEVPGRTFCGNIDRFEVGDLPWSEQSFDLVTCCDVIEHLRRPDAFLRHAAHLLKPGGALVVTTIDVDSWSSRLLGSRWVHYHRDHLWYFNRRTLGDLAARAGFRVVHNRRAQKIFDANYLLSILQAGRNFPTVQRLSGAALRLLPQILLRFQFRLAEGLLLIARKPTE